MFTKCCWTEEAVSSLPANMFPVTAGALLENKECAYFICPPSRVEYFCIVLASLSWRCFGLNLCTEYCELPRTCALKCIYDVRVASRVNFLFQKSFRKWKEHVHTTEKNICKCQVVYVFDLFCGWLEREYDAQIWADVLSKLLATGNKSK